MAKRNVAASLTNLTKAGREKIMNPPVSGLQKLGSTPSPQSSKQGSDFINSFNQTKDARQGKMSYYGSPEDLAFQQQQAQQQGQPVAEPIQQILPQTLGRSQTQPQVQQPAEAPIDYGSFQPAEEPKQLSQTPEQAQAQQQQAQQQQQQQAVARPPVKPNEDPDILKNITPDELRSTQQRIGQTILQEKEAPSNFSLSGLADSTTDLFDSVGGDNLVGYIKGLYGGASNITDSITKFGFPIFDSSFDHLTSNKNIRIPTEFDKANRVDPNSVSTVFQGKGTRSQKWEDDTDAYGTYINTIKTADEKTAAKWTADRKKESDKLDKQIEKLEKQKSSAQFTLKRKEAEALGAELESIYIDKNYVALMKKGIMDAKKRQNKLLAEHGLTPAKKESLIYGSNLGSAIFKGAAMLFTGPVPDAYGEDPAKIIAQDAEEKFQTQLAENKDLREAYGTIGKILGDERSAYNDFMKNALDMVKKRLEYSAKFRDDTHKNQIAATKLRLDKFKFLYAKKLDEKAINNHKVILNAKKEYLNQLKEQSTLEAARTEKNVDQKQLQIKQVTDANNRLKDDQYKQNVLRSENINLNVQNKQAEQAAKTKRLLDRKKLRLEQEKTDNQERKDNKAARLGTNKLQLAKKTQRQENRLKIQTESNKQSNAAADRTYKKTKSALDISSKKHAELLKAKTQTERDAVLHKYKLIEQKDKQKFDAKQKSLDRTAKAYTDMSPREQTVSKFQESYRAQRDAKGQANLEKQIKKLNPRDNKEILKSVSILKGLDNKRFKNVSHQGTKEIKAMHRMIDQATINGKGLTGAQMDKVRTFNNKYDNFQSSPQKEILADKKSRLNKNFLAQRKFHNTIAQQTLKNKQYKDKLALEAKNKKEEDTADAATDLNKRTVFAPKHFKGLKDAGKLTIRNSDKPAIKAGRTFLPRIQDVPKNTAQMMNLIKYSYDRAGAVNTVTKLVGSFIPGSKSANEQVRYENDVVSLLARMRKSIVGPGVSSDKDMALIREYLGARKGSTFFAGDETPRKFIRLLTNWNKSLINDIRNIYEDSPNREAMIKSLENQYKQLDKYDRTLSGKSK